MNKVAYKPTDRAKTLGDILAARLKEHAITIGFAEKQGFSMQVHHEVYEDLRLAGILKKKHLISNREFDNVRKTYKEFEASFDGVDFLLEIEEDVA